MQIRNLTPKPYTQKRVNMVEEKGGFPPSLPLFCSLLVGIDQIHERHRAFEDWTIFKGWSVHMVATLETSLPSSSRANIRHILSPKKHTPAGLWGRGPGTR